MADTAGCRSAIQALRKRPTDCRSAPWPSRPGALAAVVLATATLLRAAALPVSPVAAQGPSPTPPPDLIVDGGRVTLSGRHVFDRVILRNRGTIEIKAYSGTEDSGRLELVARHIEIDRSARIQGSFGGYRGQPRAAGEGPGGGEGGLRTFDGGAGGGYGGEGGDGVLDNQGQPGALGGRAYGNACGPNLDRGSAGGAPGTADNRGDPGAGGHGGAALVLIAETVLITGTIELNGAEGLVAANDAAGGGSGGGLLVRAQRLEQTGRIEAEGGDGGETDDGGGGGGGGRIKLFYAQGSVSRRTLSVAGGKGDGNGYRNDGRDGSICIELIPPTETPTPSATASPSATATPSHTPTSTPTTASTDTPTPRPSAPPLPSVAPTIQPTPTHTASPSPSPRPAALFLPLLLREACPIVDPRPVAMALVLDASTSMEGPSRSGRPKIAAATEAVLAALDRTEGENQVTVVVFNRQARVLVPLGADPESARAAIAGLRTEPGSHLEAGVALAAAELGRTRAGAARWMVVLTDGRPDPSTPADCLAAAESARALGIRIDTIGLGADLEPGLLRAMAGADERYHEAPDAEDLAALFAALAWRPEPCPGTVLWPGQR